MKQFFHKNAPLTRNLSYFKAGDRMISFIKQHPHLCDLIVIALAAGMIFGFISYFHRFSEPLQAKVEIDLSPLSLPKYTFFSMSRGLLAFFLSLIFSLF